jgi:hypothetical protein
MLAARPRQSRPVPALRVVPGAKDEERKDEAEPRRWWFTGEGSKLEPSPTRLGRDPSVQEQDFREEPCCWRRKDDVPERCKRRFKSATRIHWGGANQITPGDEARKEVEVREGRIEVMPRARPKGPSNSPAGRAYRGRTSVALKMCPLRRNIFFNRSPLFHVGPQHSAPHLPCVASS